MTNENMILINYEEYKTLLREYGAMRATLYTISKADFEPNNTPVRNMAYHCLKDLEAKRD